MKINQFSRKRSIPIREDFTGYTETDVPADKIAVVKHTITLTAGDRDEDYYVTKDYGADYFGNFTHWVDVNVTSLTNDAASIMYVWALSDGKVGATPAEPDDLKDIDDDGGDFLVISVGLIVVGKYRVSVFSCNAGSVTQDYGTAEIAVNTASYLSVTRSGTTITVQIYSTAALRVAGGAGDVETLTLTCVNTTFRYVYALGSYNTGNAAKDISGTVSNLRLNGYSLPYRQIGGMGTQLDSRW